MKRKVKGRKDDVAGEGARGAGAIPVLYRVSRAHRDALQDLAKRMRDNQGGRGRVNASAALRALLEQWIAGGCKLPPRADEE